MLFRVDTGSTEPIFEQLANQVRLSVLSGQLTPGTRLPSAKSVAESLDINIHTVLHAYQSLRDEGILELRRGRGAVITHQLDEAVHELRTIITRLTELTGQLDLPPKSVIAMVTASLNDSGREENTTGAQS